MKNLKSKSAQKKRDIHEDQDDRELKVMSELCPNISEIITRMMSGVASSVVVKVPGK